MNNSIFNRWKKKNHKRLSEQEENFLLSLAVLRKKRSGLPVNLWLEEIDSHKRKGRRKRIIFQGDKGYFVNIDNMVPMSIEDTPRILAKVRTELSDSEMGQIKDFIRKNKEALEQLSDEQIDFFDFVAIMKK
jgi:hypothetical protein